MSTEIALQGCAFIAMLSVIACVLMANQMQFLNRFYKERIEHWHKEAMRWQQIAINKRAGKNEPVKPDPADWWKS